MNSRHKDDPTHANLMLDPTHATGVLQNNQNRTRYVSYRPYISEQPLETQLSLPRIIQQRVHYIFSAWPIPISDDTIQSPCRYIVSLIHFVARGCTRLQCRMVILGHRELFQQSVFNSLRTRIIIRLLSTISDYHKSS